MKRHHIKISSKKIDTSSLNAQKNFDSLLQKYRRTKRIQFRKKIAFFAASLILGVVVFYSLSTMLPFYTNSTQPITQNSLSTHKTSTKANSKPADSIKEPFITSPASPPTSSDKRDSFDSLQVQPQQNPVIPSSPSTKAVGKDTSPAKEQSLDDFLSARSTSSQYFTIDNSKDTVLTAKAGTQIIIEANTFELASGEPVKQTIQVAVKEYYKLSQMIIAGLSTTSNSLPLETGGMLYLQATAENKPLQVKQGKEITLKFPFRGEEKPMQLYMGKKTTTGSIDWTLAAAQIKDESPSDDNLYQVVEKQPEFEGGMDAFYAYVRKNIRYPEQARREGIQGKVYVQFVVEKDGSLTDITILRGIGKECDQEAIRIIENSPKWIPGRLRGKPVRVRVAVPIQFLIEDATTTVETAPQTPSDSGSVSKQNGKTNSQDYYYVLKTGGLGWINCDRLLEFESGKTHAEVAIEDNQAIMVIFKNYKTILPYSKRMDGKAVFSNVPLDQPIIIVGLMLKGDTPSIAFQEITIKETPGQALSLSFEPTSAKEFEQKLRRLLKE